MKITVRKLKSLIKESADAVDVQVGEYYVIRDSTWQPRVVVRVDDIFEDPRHPNMLFVQFKQHADGVTSQNLEAFQNRVISMATSEEIDIAEEAWAVESRHIANTIDTSREGT